MPQAPENEVATQDDWPLEVPSLHLIGSKDWLRSSSEALVQRYNAHSATSFVHAFGHEIPAQIRRDQELQEVLQGFLGKF